MLTLDAFTIIACLFIIGAFVFAWVYISRIDQKHLNEKRKWMEQLPSVISTLGVLGTFLGITRGLVSFDPGNLDGSIPDLLSGLKTAFFTSLLGMSGSLVLNRIVSSKLDNVSKINEWEKAARMIVNALEANQRALPKVMEEGNKTLVEQLSGLRQDVEQMKDDVEELKGISQELKSTLGQVSSSTAAAAEELPRLRAVAVTATASVSAIDNAADEISGAISSLGATAGEIRDAMDDMRKQK